MPADRPDLEPDEVFLPAPFTPKLRAAIDQYEAACWAAGRVPEQIVDEARFGIAVSVARGTVRRLGCDG